jgi:preprotein translocase subunit SecE
VKGVIQFLKEVKLELSKVTWPKKQQIIKLTLIVFVISAVVGVYVGVLDYAFTKLLEFLIAR